MPLELESRKQRAATTSPLVISERPLQWVDESALVATPKKPEDEIFGIPFIPETGTAPPDGDSRRIIRSRARRLDATRKSQALPRGAVLAEGIGHAQDDYLKLLDHDLRRVREVRGLEPFNALPVAGTSQIHLLLYHFDRVIRHSRGLAGPRQGWLSFAVSDPAVLNVILSISSLDLASHHGKIESTGLFYYKAATIRIINKRLRDPNYVATDGTIAAVASLSHLENLAGTPESAKIHAEGLELMIKSRGGLQNLGEAGMPRRIVSWSDVCTSIILETKPRYPLIVSDLKSSEEKWGPYTPIALRYRAKISSLTGSRKLGFETLDIYWELCNLFRYKESSALGLIVDEYDEELPYTDAVYILERRILELAQLEPLSQPTQANCVYTLFAYATFLNIYIFMRDCSKELPFNQLLASRIYMILTHPNINMSILKIHYPELMLWVLIMGGLAGNANSEGPWFVKSVADFCLELGLVTGIQIAHMLGEWMWSDLYISPVTRRFWQEVALALGKERTKAFETRRLQDKISLIYYNTPPDVEVEYDDGPAGGEEEDGQHGFEEFSD